MALGCNYEAPTWGSYSDGACAKGYLWDLDSCDEPGGPLTHGGDIPCPWCNTAEYVDWEHFGFSGSARQRRTQRRALIVRVKAWAESRSTFPPETGRGAA
jgi:hypothetical protein